MKLTTIQVKPKFQLTRSVGSVTCISNVRFTSNNISTHTLRGERDQKQKTQQQKTAKFQLTRSVGSVTRFNTADIKKEWISTHTLRGERDGGFFSA